MSWLKHFERNIDFVSVGKGTNRRVIGCYFRWNEMIEKIERRSCLVSCKNVMSTSVRKISRRYFPMDDIRSWWI